MLFRSMTPSPLSIVPNPRDIGDLLKTIRQVRPAFFNGIPTLYTAILNHPDVRAGEVDLSSIKLCFSGAAALMAETKRQFEEATGARIVEGYSLTEAMMALVVNPVEGANKAGSVGMPLPDIDLRIYDAEDGVKELGPHEVGEICISGMQLMVEFHRRRRRLAGQTTVAALSEAQRSLLRSEGHYRHPYYWAAFIVVGGYSEH
mgnify:CR=1 FL=1